MLTVDEFEAIRRAYYCEQQSIRAIAREQNHHRWVVREAIAGTSPSPRQYRQQRARARPMVDPVRPLVDAWLEGDRAAPPKQRHTAKRIFERLGLVIFEHNRYSVPSQHAGEHLLLRAYPRQVEITTGTTVVARHARLCGKDGEQIDPLHYLAVLERKPGAFEHARPIQYWAKTWPPIYQQYLDALRAARPEGATREFVRILQLHGQFSVEAITAALERVLALRCWSADGVEQVVRQGAVPIPASVPLDPAVLTRFPAIDIPLPDLHGYDQLLAEVPA